MTTSTDIADRYRTPVTLEGQHVRLVPLTLEHAASLFRALNGDEELWRYIPVEQPRTLVDMRGWIGTALEEHTQQRRVPFAVVETAGTLVIGSTSYVNMSPSHRHLDIGWTWYAREYWRTAVNTECKYLLLRYAFETLGCIRVQLRVDRRNLRSQRAVERIGGIKEGVLRKAQILYDGHERSVVLYSLLDEEWPSRKAWFEETLRR
jgi:RimJ/RimL family protein N-acetyltransferase